MSKMKLLYDKDTRNTDDFMISVIIPCYNQGIFIDQAVQSILSQTYKNFEIIIINDGSTDKYTNSLLKKYKQPKAKVYHTTNQGVTATRKYGVELAKGDYIQFLDADDFVDCRKFEEQMIIFKANQSVDVCYTNYDCYHDETGEHTQPSLSVKLGVDPLEDFIYKWQRSLSIPIHSAIFKSSVFRGEEVIISGFHGVGDWITWISIARKGARFYFLDKNLASYRSHNNSITRNITHMFYWATRAVSYIADHYIDAVDMDRFNKEQGEYLKYLANMFFHEDLNNRVNNLNKELSDLNNRVNNLNKELSDLNNRVNNLNKELSDLNNRVNNLNKELSDLNNQVTQFRTSSSWRLTKPLRLVKVVALSSYRYDGIRHTSKKILRNVYQKIRI